MSRTPVFGGHGQLKEARAGAHSQKVWQTRGTQARFQ